MRTCACVYHTDWYFELIEDEYKKITDKLNNATLFGYDVNVDNIKELVVASYMMGKCEEMYGTAVKQ